MEVEQGFTYHSARSGSLLAGLGLVLLVETVVLHLWLGARHPVLAWTLTVTSLSVILWLVADYRAMARGAVRLSHDILDLRVGRRFAVRLARTEVIAAIRPGWRDLPEAGTPAAAGFLNLMKPATPNVLLTLAHPARVRLPGGMRRTVRQLGLHLDEPERFLSAIGGASVRDAGVRAGTPAT